MQMLANPTDTAWTNLPRMISPVSNFVAGVIGTKLYVAGGLRWEHGWRIASDELQVFDFETRTWSLGPQLPGPRYYGAGCVCDGRLYLVGGKDESRSLTRGVIVFSPESPAGWSQVKSLPEFRYYHSCCAYKGKVLVFGGEGDGEAFPPLLLSSISGRQYSPPEEQFWLSELVRNETRDVLGRALATTNEGFSVQVGSLNEELTARTLVRFGFDWNGNNTPAHPLGDLVNLVDRELASKLYRRLDDDAAVLSIPPLPAGYDHPLLAAIVCSAPVG